MNFRSLLLSVPIALPLLLVTPMAQARTIPAAQALGQQGALPTLKVAPGEGENLNFGPTGHRVYKAIVDHKALLELEFDRNPSQGATIVHLSAKKETGKTRLTLIALDGGGRKYVYVFNVQMSTKGSDGLITIAPQLTVSGNSPIFGSTQPVSTPSSTAQVGVKAIRQGMQLALSKGRLAQGDKLWKALERFNALVESGVPAYQSANENNLDLAFISELMRLGRNLEPSIEPVPPQVDSDLLVKKLEMSEPAKRTPQKNVSASKNQRKKGTVDKFNADSVAINIKKAKPESPSSRHIKVVAEEIQATVKKGKESAVVSVAPPRAGDLPAKAITTMDQAEAIEKGLIIAQEEGAVEMRSKTTQRVKDVISRLRRGQNRQYAARLAGVSQVLIEELLTLGGLPPAKPLFQDA